MPKLGIFLNQCLPLSEIFILQQAQALKNYQPHFIACRKPASSLTTHLPEIILNRRGSFFEKIREAIFKATGRNGLLEKAVKEADIVHAHFGPAGWLASGLAQRTGKPLIVTLHGFDVLKNDINFKRDGLLQTLYFLRRKKLGARANAFICVSDYVRQKAIVFGFPAEKCHVIYMGIPIHDLPSAVTKNNEKIRLLVAGRLVEFKGHTKLIEAAAQLERAGYDIHLDIAGDGPLRSQLEAQAKASLKNYTFHGALPHPKILELMRQSDVFCHPSVVLENGQTEAFGLVVLEAQAMGLPVVAFASGGVPEAIADGTTGILCESGNATAFAAALRELIDHPGKRIAMSEAAPGFVASRFDNRLHTEKLEALYDLIAA